MRPNDADVLIPAVFYAQCALTKLADSLSVSHWMVVCWIKNVDNYSCRSVFSGLRIAWTAGTAIRRSPRRVKTASHARQDILISPGIAAGLHIWASTIAGFVAVVCKKVAKFLKTRTSAKVNAFYYLIAKISIYLICNKHHQFNWPI